jgi:hypothetical protein
LSIYLASKQLTGTLPAAFGSLSSLTDVLWLEDLALTGTIPSSLGSLESLSTGFELLDVTLSGTIPSSLGSLTELDGYFELMEMNLLTGTIPSSLGSLSNLELNFIIQGQMITGTVPPIITSLHMLSKDFFIASTSITGTIPNGFVNMTDVETFNFSRSNFSGKVEWPCTDDNDNIMYLHPTKLDFSKNQLSHIAIPHVAPSSSFCVDPSGLEFFDIGHNPLINFGTIPARLSSLTSLLFLGMSNCNMCGTVPSFLGNIGLTTLDLSKNTLSGPLPQALAFNPLVSQRFHWTATI